MPSGRRGQVRSSAGQPGPGPGPGPQEEGHDAVAEQDMQL